MPELEPNAILEFCNEAIKNGATYDEVISQLELTRDTLSEEEVRSGSDDEDEDFDPDDEDEDEDFDDDDDMDEDEEDFGEDEDDED